MTETAARRNRLRRRLAKLGEEAFSVSARPNILYLTGFSGSEGRLLLTPQEAVLFVDGRYRTQSAQQAAGVDIVVSEPPQKPFDAFLETLRKLRIRRLAFERNRLSYAAFGALQQADAKRRLSPVDGAVEGLRLIKSETETDAIRRSVELNSKAFEEVSRRVRRTWTEQRFAAEIDYAVRRLGADGAAFETIVASGEHGALPHAQPRSFRLASNSLVVVDHGAILGNYASDMTRVMALGAPSLEARRLHQAVREAQQEALATVRSGVKASTVDESARARLRKAGLGECFPHSTGHGLGLEIHEGPRLGPGEQMRLKEGMVVTIEPGAYVEGLGGARIEDVVVVRRGGCDVLSHVERDLFEI